MLKDDNGTKLMEELNEFSENISEGIPDDGIDKTGYQDDDLEISHDSEIEEMNPYVMDEHFDAADINDEDIVDFDIDDYVEEEYDSEENESDGEDGTSEVFSGLSDFDLPDDEHDITLTDSENAAEIEESDGSELEEEVDIEAIVRKVDLLSDFTPAEPSEKQSVEQSIPEKNDEIAEEHETSGSVSDDEVDFVITHVEGYEGLRPENFFDGISGENTASKPDKTRVEEHRETVKPAAHKKNETAKHMTAREEEGDGEVIFEEIDKDLIDGVQSLLPEDFVLEPIDLDEAQMIADEDIVILNEDDLIQELDTMHLTRMKSGQDNSNARGNHSDDAVTVPVKQQDQPVQTETAFTEEEPFSENDVPVIIAAEDENEPAEVPEMNSEISYLGDSRENISDICENFIAENAESSDVTVVADSVIENSMGGAPEILDITSHIVILDDENVDTFVTANIDESKQKDMRKLLSYLDGLFENLPEDLIRKFADSEYFDLYVKVMNDLGA